MITTPEIFLSFTKKIKMMKPLWVNHVYNYNINLNKCKNLTYSFFVIGVLLKWGNGTMSHFKLSSSNTVTIIALNKYGASVQQNLTVNVNNIL